MLNKSKGMAILITIAEFEYTWNVFWEQFKCIIILLNIKYRKELQFYTNK
jgi:hypothetical protein